MIFDFYLSYFTGDHFSDAVRPASFRTEPFYSDIAGQQAVMALRHGSVTCLHRREYGDHFAEVEGIKLWIFGFVFITKNHAATFGKRPFRITAKQLLKMRQERPQDYMKCLKGSFVLILVDESRQSVSVVTDRLNVLPLYYARSGNRLVISSNTSMMMQEDWINREIDPLAMTMQCLFDYTLGEYYFVKGIRRFENASYYEFDAHAVRRKTYWDVQELYHDRLIPRKAALDMVSEQLKENVNLYGSDSATLLVSLTGGFDGRANLALLERDPGDILCYSYGMPGSKQIRVPETIASRIGIPYRPVYLDDAFLERYQENSLKASCFSNGTAPIGFSNIPYAYSELSLFSDTAITGLFGSEILRPLHNNGIQVNDASFEIFLNSDYRKGVADTTLNALKQGYFRELTLKDMGDELSEYLRKAFFEKYRDFDPVTRFFFFIIQEGVRKYFSQEISIERVYLSTRFPYFDVDLVDLIYQTPWAGMYNGFLGESRFKRRNGQLLYAHIIKKYKPELGKLVLDRGYCPNDLMRPFPFNYMRIAMGVHRAKRYMRRHGGNDTFKTETWALNTIRNIVGTPGSAHAGSLFGDRLAERFFSDRYLDDFLTFRHMVSIQAFLNTIQS